MGYSIYGAGNNSNNPVTIKVACGEVAIIPYIVKYENNDSCNPITEFYSYNKEVNAITDCRCTGSSEYDNWTEEKTISNAFTGEHNLTVYYKIISDVQCHKEPSCKDNCSIGDYWITKGDGTNIIVNYEKFSFSNCDEVERTVERVVTSCTDNIITIDTGCGPLSFKYECHTECSSSSSTIVNIKGVSFIPLTVEYSGGTVKTMISYEKIVTDEECNKRKYRGTINIDAKIEWCSGNICCHDHYVSFTISKSKILSALKLPRNTVVNYNGKPIRENVSFSIMQKANKDAKCDDDCEYKITYCVLEDLEHKIKVEYETYWGSNIWISQGTIPPYGGRVKISFDYYATAMPVNESGDIIENDSTCKPYNFNGSDFVLVEIPACDEGSSDIMTLTGEILYKERTPFKYGCANTFPEGSHVSAETITDVVTSASTVMNLIIYDVEQTCTGMCEPIQYKEYKPLHVTAEACDTTISGNVEYDIVNVDENCNVKREYGGTELISVAIEPNDTDSVRVITNDYFVCTQEAGPCHYTGCIIVQSGEIDCHGGVLTFSIERKE